MENLAKMSPNGDYLKTNETLSIALNEIPELRVEMREGFLKVNNRLDELTNTNKEMKSQLSDLETKIDALTDLFILGSGLHTCISLNTNMQVCKPDPISSL